MTRENRKLLWFVSLAALIVVLHKPIEDLLSRTVVEHALKYVERSNTNDVVFGLAFLTYATILIFRWCRKYVPSYTVWGAMLALSVFYLIYRLHCLTTWQFISFEHIEYLKYADILLGITGLDTILVARAIRSTLILNAQEKKNKDKWWAKIVRLLSRKEVGTPNPNAFADDAPLKFENKEDLDKELLGYGNYAKTIADKIKVTSSERAFAIGINGQWGSGKSTFMAALKHHLKGDPNIIYMDFNAWSGQTPTAIIENFFDALHDTLGLYHSAAARLLVSYSHKLVKYEDSFFTQALQSFTAVITGVNSIEKLHENVSQAIKETGKKLIVYIDDLDRADQAEVLEILRLVRNTADFPNTFFIVAYDRDYVVKALTNHQVHNSDRFLEKIFQLEVNLPYFEKKNLIEKLVEKLKESLDISFHQEIEYYIKNAKGENRQILLDWISTPRDVIRLVNAIAVNSKNLKPTDINFDEFFKLQLLRIKYPSIYETLWKQKHRLFQFANIIEEKTILIGTALLNKYIEESNEKIKIDRILSSIFEYKINDNKRNSVSYATTFNRYFAYNVMDLITEKEFNKISSYRYLLFEKTNSWIADKLELEVADMFYKKRAFDDLIDYQNIILGIFYFANQQDKVQYSFEDLYLKIHNKNILKNNKKECSNFIEKILKKQPYPYMSFELQLIKYSINRPLRVLPQEEFLLRDNTISGILCHYMEEYTKNNNLYNIKSVLLYENLLKITKDDYKSRLNNFIKKELVENNVVNFNNFLISLLYESNRGSNKFEIHSHLYINLYKDDKEFRSELERRDSTEIVVNFIAFLDSLNNKNVQYNFPENMKNRIRNWKIEYEEEEKNWNRVF